MEDVERSVLVHERDWDEERVVSLLVDEDGSVLVEERTDGVVTELVFGTLTCVRKLTISASDALGVPAALGNTLGCAESIARFMQGERCLSDLQDALDAAGVGYAFTIRCGNDFALRQGVA